MIKRLLIPFLLLAFFLLFFSFQIKAWSDLVKEGDTIIEDGRTADDFQEAINLYQEALTKSPDNYQILWRLGKSHLMTADELPKEKRLVLYEKGKEYTEKAIELAPDSPDSYYWYASLTGRIGQTRGILQSLFMVKPMKEALHRVLELDPQYASAYYVLSMLYMEAPGWPLSIGNKNLSLENALRSVELEDDNYDFLFNLAQVYLDHNEKRKAQEILEDLLEHPEVQTEEKKKIEIEEILSSL